MFYHPFLLDCGAPLGVPLYQFAIRGNYIEVKGDFIFNDKRIVKHKLCLSGVWDFLSLCDYSIAQVRTFVKTFFQKK
jgi:hypothetical protein|uniref:Uncharacterized protein n=1 Tax=Siphoviridae sp. ctB3v5 TaxID=2826186 RepID=A0A8S5M8V6_9CAUD|nr:MAG TPA: hypothetical protein [Siphoviridae sp. ctB3v5]